MIILKSTGEGARVFYNILQHVSGSICRVIIWLCISLTIIVYCVNIVCEVVLHTGNNVEKKEVYREKISTCFYDDTAGCNSGFC